MIKDFTTERLVLRAWRREDADSLFRYASDPRIGPAAGWPPHQTVEESAHIIDTVLFQPESYAITLRDTDEAIGAIALKMGDATDLTDRADECELGYWIGVDYWGRGLVPEACRELIRHAFEDLGMRAVWCAYYDGNHKSARVQDKLGFVFHHTSDNVPVPQLGEDRTGHVNLMTRDTWEAHTIR
ncbi:GNAT family N-acetyltransferase [Schaalia sp. ZJ405]|uniref:GNAT family N-acetyltransferase n=1 Tax=Schaalia sp. ZJ405 TaxID=2709403 RepID=UPI0013EA2D97|nr:GNAT family N-acetyltransferase [Schaalia sp. ZJ405]QPK81601.1 GNAT family N-acetyltransferase [Schaalia sp. ZJ405]